MRNLFEDVRNLFNTHAHTKLCFFPKTLRKRFLSVEEHYTHRWNMEQSTEKEGTGKHQRVLQMREEGKQAAGRKTLSHLLC